MTTTTTTCRRCGCVRTNGPRTGPRYSYPPDVDPLVVALCREYRHDWPSLTGSDDRPARNLADDTVILALKIATAEQVTAMVEVANIASRRGVLVHELQTRGWSLQRIADALGVHKSTIAKLAARPAQPANPS